MVAHIVDVCTDTYEDPKPPWRGRKETYVAHVRERVGSGGDEPALRVSLADKLYNTRSILADVRESGEAVFERFSGKRDGTLGTTPRWSTPSEASPTGWSASWTGRSASSGARPPTPSRSHRALGCPAVARSADCHGRGAARTVPRR